MLVPDILTNRLKRGCETMAYPQGPAPALPDRHGGALRVEAAKCADGCNACVPVCPTQAITRSGGAPVALDLGRCIFCAECVAACPTKAITQTGDHRMAVRRREDLMLGGAGGEVRLAAALDEKLRRMFGRSLRLRQVSAGGCNACEADTNVLGTIGWDLGRFGIQFVASPRHADGLLITGPVSRNMELALRKTWEAVPEPKIVVAVGACAIAGGPFVGNPEHLAGAAAVVPVDLFIPGCPPHPLTILDGLLRLLDRLEERAQR
ncbi:MAG: 4Fe-4S dicluster domain-containing protein [Verrucomicrobiota bacterium]